MEKNGNRLLDNLKNIVRNNIKAGYDLNDARSKAAQDVILNKIAKSKFKKSITIKGGVVMHSISNSVRRATRDLDFDFIKYSLKDEFLKNFINVLNKVDDNIIITIIGEIEELHHQDYSGKRINIKLTDKNSYVIDTKLDIGIHKLFELEQDEYFFNLDALEEGVSLFINSPEQIFTEKLKSLLKLGIRSTRYKDLFDFYFLIKSKKLDDKKLLQTFKIIIFNDDNMIEKTINNIYSRLNKILNSKVYRSNLENPKNNWLDVPVGYAINCVLEYINNLAREKVNT